MSIGMNLGMNEEQENGGLDMEALKKDIEKDLKALAPGSTATFEGQHEKKDASVYLGSFLEPKRDGVVHMGGRPGEAEDEVHSRIKCMGASRNEYVDVKTPEQISEAIAEFEKQGFRVIPPGHVPSPEEVALMKIRSEKSRESREHFATKCKEIAEAPPATPTEIFASQLFERFVCKKFVEEAKSASARSARDQYAPRTLKGRVLFFLEGAFSWVSSWFSFREAPKAAVPAPNVLPYKSDEMKYVDSLAKIICEEMENNDGIPHDAYLNACWDMMQDIKDGNLLVNEGEKKIDAIRRVIKYHQDKFEHRQKVRAEEDYQLGFVDHRVDLDELNEESPPPHSIAPNKKVATVRDAKLGNMTDPKTLEIMSSMGIRIAPLPSKMTGDDVAPGIVAKAPPEDPLLQSAKEERLKELLSRQILTEDEKKQLADLTSDEVTVL